MLGSDRARARKSIDAALAMPAVLQLGATLAGGDASHLAVAWTAPAAPVGAALHVALVERGLRSDVRRGENRGRVLEHDNVVRAFVSVPLAARGTVELAVPSDLRREHASVILFAQDAETHRVLGATTVDLAPGQSRASN